MRYLDRDPKPGDRVHVPAYEAEYLGPWMGWEARTFPHRVRADGYGECMASEVRVIAPEPHVGDVVTADTVLPYSSIIAEAGFGGIAQRTRTCDREVYLFQQRGLELGALLRSVPSDWRIVRIGGAQ